MTSEVSEFNKIALQIEQGQTPNPATVRQILEWCGVKRRSYWNRHYIDTELDKAGIVTQPDYKETWVDFAVNFLSKIVTEEPAAHSDEGASSEESSPGAAEKMIENFSYQIGRLEAANRPFVSVKPNATLQEAYSKMLFNNFSQLPVIINDYNVKGVISLSSICARIANDLVGQDVQFYMDDPREISSKTSLFAAAKIIADAGYVLVRGADRKITGIVTSSDLNTQMEQMSTPFLLLSEIENHVRDLIRKKIDLAKVKEICKSDLTGDISDVSELTFGNYVRVMQNTEAWSVLGLKFDQKYFCEELELVRQVRNDVMHFDPDPIEDGELIRLRNFSRMFDQWRNIGAF